METARARTSTSRGFRSGTLTAGRTSRTSGPPNRGKTTALHEETAAAAAAVEAGLSPTAGLRGVRIRRPPSRHMARMPPSSATAYSPVGGRRGREGSGEAWREECMWGQAASTTSAGMSPFACGGVVGCSRPRRRSVVHTIRRCIGSSLE